MSSTVVAPTVDPMGSLVDSFQSFLIFFFVLIVVLILFVIGAYAWIWFQKFKNRNRNLKDKTFFKIITNEENEIEPAAAEQMYSSFYGLRKEGFMNSLKEQDHVSFEIVGSQDSIDFYAVCPKHLENLVEKQINATYPEAEITKVDPWDIWKSNGHVCFSSLILRKEDHLPITSYENQKVDSVAILTGAMSKLGEGEGLGLQILIRPANDKWQKIGKTYIKNFVDKHNQTDKDGKPKGPRMTKVEDEHVDGVNAKISKIGFETVIRLVSVAKDEVSAKSNLVNLEQSFEQFNRPGFNSFKKAKNHFSQYFVISFLARMFPAVDRIDLPFEIPNIIKKEAYKGLSILNTEELASIWHMPNKNVRTPRIAWLRSKGSAAPIELPDSGLYLGKSEFRGQEIKVFMDVEDRRRHMYILGTTGTGKSEFMKFMAVQDIIAGKGVAFIDPHGSAVQDIVQQVPPERMDDVIYFDPSSDRPMGLNLLDVKTEKEKDLVINKFIDMLYELYDPNKQGIMGPQLERALRMCMLTTMSKPGGTMVEVVRLLTDENYHKDYLPFIKDPLVKEYWTAEMANTTKNRKGEVLGYFVSKLDRFVTEKTMRYMLGQTKSSFDFQVIMDSNKILLVDLSKGKLGEENSRFLGLLLIPRLLGAAFARGEQIERGIQPDDFYLYIDEFQNYTTPDIQTILSEARKYRLNLTVANQFVGQLPDNIKDAIFGNVGTMTIFRVGTDDAEYLEKYFKPTFAQNDLMNNKVGRAYMKLLVHGQPSPAFAMTTDWPMIRNMPRDFDRGEDIKKASRKKYGRNRFIVEQEIRDRSGKS